MSQVPRLGRLRSKHSGLPHHHRVCQGGSRHRWHLPVKGRVLSNQELGAEGARSFATALDKESVPWDDQSFLGGFFDKNL